MTPIPRRLRHSQLLIVALASALSCTREPDKPSQEATVLADSADTAVVEDDAVCGAMPILDWYERFAYEYQVSVYCTHPYNADEIAAEAAAARADAAPRCVDQLVEQFYAPVACTAQSCIESLREIQAAILSGEIACSERTDAYIQSPCPSLYIGFVQACPDE